MISVRCPSVEDTRFAGARLAAHCVPGDVILLVGQLGAGKTAFVSGIADGLGVEGPVTSPSYVIMRRYDDGFLPLVHVDVYRLGSLGEFADLDVWEESQNGVLVIEWGTAVGSKLPEDRLVVRIDVDTDECRTITFEAMGKWKTRRLDDLGGVS